MKDAHAPRPPRLARWLLHRVLPRDGRAAAIAGDLIEEFNADAASRSRAAAAARYWRHTLSISARYAFTRRHPMRAARPARLPMLLYGMREDLRDARRSLFKSPGFAAVAVLTLAVGVGANTAIFSVLHAVVLRDLPFRNADRLALLWTWSLRQHLRDGSSYLNFRDWKEHSREFEDMAVYRRPEFTRGTIAGGQGSQRIHLVFVGPGFFDVLGASPLLGRALEGADFGGGHRAVVISHSLWRQQFAGTPDAIGRSIDVDGAACEIVGVMSADFTFPNADVQLWQPISLLRGWNTVNPAARDGDGLMVIGRLTRAATFDSARAELDTIAARLRDAYPDANADNGVLIEPLSEHVLGPRTARSLWLLFGAVGFVLLIACSNVANLALARGVARHTEFSVRTALGASRTRLVRQALTESLVIAAFAATAGLFFAWLAATALRTWTSGAVPRLEMVQLDVNVFLFALAVSLTCGVLAGLLPALQLSTMNPAGALREGGPRALGGRGDRRLRHGLVVAELALAVVLLAGAGLLVRSFVRLQATDRGFDSRHVLILQVDLPDKYDDRGAVYFREALERVRALPGVAAAGAVTNFFIRRHGDLEITLEGQPSRRPGDPVPPLIRDWVIPGYFEAMRIPLVRGRFLRDSDLDPQAPPVAVINEEMARRFWPGEDPVGKRLKNGNEPWETVVGVVADMRRRRLDERAFPSFFEPGISGRMDVAVRTLGDPHAMRDAIRAALMAVEPLAPPYGIVTGEQRLGESVALRTLQTLLLGALAAAALILAVIGVYSIIHQSVVARTQEIGLRMALGATPLSVMRMILSGALGLAAVGLGLGLAGAVALGRTMSSFLYETSAVDSLTFASVPLLLIAVTTVACLAPACRAARVDPMAALRAE